MTSPDDRSPVGPQSSVSDEFVVRWNELSPIEQRLVAMAVDAITAGSFTTLQAWHRFVDTATELLALVESGALTPEELHAMALDAGQPTQRSRRARPAHRRRPWRTPLTEEPVLAPAVHRIQRDLVATGVATETKPTATTCGGTSSFRGRDGDGWRISCLPPERKASNSS